MRKRAKRAKRASEASGVTKTHIQEEIKKTPQNDLRKITMKFHFPDQK